MQTSRHKDYPTLAALALSIMINSSMSALEFYGSFLTGSSVMFAEGIHSLADIFNASTLFIGRRLSRRPPDDNHPFGRGKELYFWSLVVAILIFGTGAGSSFFEGISHIDNFIALHDIRQDYAILGAAAVLEIILLLTHLREFSDFRRQKTLERASLTQSVKLTKDPTHFTLTFESIASLVGILAAFLGIYLSNLLGNGNIDPTASIVFGMVLGGISTLLVRESKGLLIGQSATPSIVKNIQDLSRRESEIMRAEKILTMHFGPDEVLLNLNIRFHDGLSASQIGTALDKLERGIRVAHPETKHIFIDVEGLEPERR